MTARILELFHALIVGQGRMLLLIGAVGHGS